jgi:galactose mutarotase-like enzyme
MSVTFIENAALRVGVNVGYGARVVSLFDKAAGREWVTQGAASANTGEDADYSGDEAIGWDECFPTVSPWDASATNWGRRLRDHGDLWGRAFQVDAASATALTLSYADPQFRFTRELRLDGTTLIVRYAVENRLARPLPYLWALHALLAVTDKDHIVLPGVDSVRPTFMALRGQTIAAPTLNWPELDGKLPFSLDAVQPANSLFAGKFFASGAGRLARVGHAGEWLEIAWDASIQHLGMWFTYGAWPSAGGHHEVALEPTNASADDLGQAIDSGAPPLTPGERREWQVSFSVTG